MRQRSLSQCRTVGIGTQHRHGGKFLLSQYGDTNNDTNHQIKSLVHYGFDLVLVSIILAAVHRNTGLVFDTSHFSSVDIRRWFGNYLAIGERGYDYTVSLLRMSGYFKQRNLMLDMAERKANELLKSQTGRDVADFTETREIQ
ncbi:hypothetical protein DIURU_003814 [Diutina rugosa]|uniref:DUF1748-domain-containing protein n=1 Tax=Diutina rugosa TaxID=5481 RepID=A0A642ULU1_DIURU|nr:uncharacterized protein DIURU_003814 [Diutina rugosa]KAA8900391.1 hypothetical protein DIURU_003814 [Diutina rugosa]